MDKPTIDEIIEGDDSDEVAVERLISLYGFSRDFASGLVLANRHDGTVDNVAVSPNADTSGPGWPD